MRNFFYVYLAIGLLGLCFAVPIGGGSWDEAFPGNVSVNGIVTANKFVGDGSGLTGISAQSSVTADVADTANIAVSMDAKGLMGAITVATGNEVVTVLENGNVGIGTTTPDAKLDVNGDTILGGDLTVEGDMILSTTATGDISAAGGITVVGSIMRVQGDSALVDLTANPQISVGIDGQLLTLVGKSDSKIITLEDGNGLVLAGGVTFSLGADDIIQLVFLDGVWREVNRVNN